MSKKNNAPREAEAKVSAVVRKPKDLAAVALQEVATAQQAPDYPNQPTVQAAVSLLLAEATALGKTVGGLVAGRAGVATLETTRAIEVLAVQRDRKGLASAITLVCKGSAVAIAGWGSKMGGRTVVAETMAAPLDVAAKTTAVLGMVEVHCKADGQAVSYLFQMGTEPATPQTWPAPVVWATSKYAFTGLTPGQKVYFRMAIVRRKTGAGLWSDAVQVTTR